MSCYDDVNSKVEYLDLSHRQLGVEGVLDVIHDLGDDTILRHVNLSYNIPLDAFANRDIPEYFIKRLKKYLLKNKSLTALDLAGNHLFHYHPHPTNEHVKYYEIELTDALLTSGITRIDLSDNNLNGYTGREMKGYIYFLKQFLSKKEGFIARRNLINSQGLMSLASFSLGIHSTLTYLDLSDNNCGLDPQGYPCSEGIQALASSLGLSLHLKTLKLARNLMRDNDFELISEAVQMMPQFQDLDLSGNVCKQYGIRAIREAVIAHSIVCDNTNGFRELSLSYNLIGDEGAKELAIAIRRTTSLEILRIAGCGIEETGGEVLQDALATNSTIIIIDVFQNLMSMEQESLIIAEVEANELIYQIRESPMEVDANTLSQFMYEALAKKLRFLEQEVLQQLHFNESFNVPESIMKDALHILEPPPRRLLVQEVKNIDPKLELRIQQSKLVTKKAESSRIIFKVVMRWYRGITQGRRLLEAIKLAQEREHTQNSYNLEDDMFNYGRAGESFK